MENHNRMMYQKQLAFDKPTIEEGEYVAQATSQPPPRADQKEKVPPLVQPDRQLTYGGSDPCEWPHVSTLQDVNTITVDRLATDIDGPPHRFLICRGDQVEVNCAPEKFAVGEVVEIDHEREEVQVQFPESLECFWFYKGQVYPVPVASELPSRNGPRTGEVGREDDEPLLDMSADSERVAPSVTKEHILTFLAEHPDQAFGMNELCQRFLPERKLDADSCRCHPVGKLLHAIGEAGEATVARPAFAEPRFQALPPPLQSTTTPYTFNEFKAFYAEPSVTFERFQSEFQRIWESQDALRAELVARYKAPQLKRLTAGFGGIARSYSTKEENAASIVRRMLAHFVLDGSVSYSPLSGETYEDAVKKKVERLTAGEYYRHFEKEQEKSLAKEQALADPRNLADFHTFVEIQGEDALTDEQFARYDALRADLQRELRASQKTKTTVERFASDELKTITFTRKEGYHDKRQCPLTIVQLETRVEREAFNELNRKAKQLGGWYSSFKKSDAGFQFLQESQAERFCELLAGDVDRMDVLEARKERRELSAAECLHKLAANLMVRAEETIACSNESLQNTARRADIQAGVRGRAYADQAMSRTIHSLAEALSRGEAKYLDGIRHKTQLETLDTVLHLAKWARVRAVKKLENESSDSHGLRQRRIEEEPVSLATIRFVEFPYPHTYRRHLDEAIQKGRLTKGVKQAADKLKKYLGSQAGDYVEFSREYEVEALLDFLDRAKAQGVDVEWVSRGCENYKRLVRANITSLPELRAALREYLDHRAERRRDDPVRIAERELIGKDLPGFFPTPRPVIDRMLELADIKASHQVLEPSCGKGDILDALRELYPGLSVHAIEQNRTLSDVLAAKGYDVEFCDFLDHDGTYDRILMNPPFDGDIEHVRHAYALLVPGGRLVSVMSEGPLFRSDRQAAEFRAWLLEVGGESELLPEDAFQGREAFRRTGVRTRLVTIDKEDHA